MSRVGVLLIGVAGCFSQPPPPGDAAHQDASTCLQYSEWSTPEPIVFASFDTANDAATSPWLNDAGDNLFFTRLVGGDANMPMIMQVQKGAGGWGTPAPVDLGVAIGDDNPFLSDNQLSLWFDSERTGTRMIYEAQRQSPSGTFDAPIPYTALGNVEEPAVSPDGTVLYYSQNQSTLFRTERNTDTDAFTPGVQLPSSATIEAPSISAQLDRIYVSDHGSTERLATATFGGDTVTLVGMAEVGTFQSSDPAVVYFDPNISRDNLTLVFASDFEHTPHAQLYTTTRTCTIR